MADYTCSSKTADSQQDIMLRRQRKAIAVFEKDMVTTIEAGQRLHAKRFLNNLKKSEMLLKEHESTKTMLFTRRNKLPTDKEPAVSRNGTDVSMRIKNRPSSSPRKTLSEEGTQKRAQSTDEKPPSRIFSVELREINKNLDVPYVKLSSYTKEDLKRPATSLELKRKVWEEMNNHLETNHGLRPPSASFVERCASNVPRNVQEARDKLRAFTKLKFLSQLPPAPPRIDVEKAQCQRRELEQIEKKVVEQFCESLVPLKTVLPESFRLMDVSEVYSKNTEVQRLFERTMRDPREIRERERRDRAMTCMQREGGAIGKTKRHHQGASKRQYHHRHSHPFSTT